MTSVYSVRFLVLSVIPAALAQDLVISGSVYQPSGTHAYSAVVKRRSKKNATDKDSMSVHGQAEFLFSRLFAEKYDLVATQKGYYSPVCLEVDPTETKKAVGISLKLNDSQEKSFGGDRVRANDNTPQHLPVRNSKMRVVLRCDDWDDPIYVFTDSDGIADLTKVKLPAEGYHHLELVRDQARGVVPVEHPLTHGSGPSADPEADAGGPVDQDRASPETQQGNDQKLPGLETVAGKRPGIPLVVTDEIKVKSLTVNLVTGVVTENVGLSKREKGKLHIGRLYGLAPFILSAIPAAINQWRDVPHEWGQGSLGFGRRYGSAYLYSFGVQNAMAFALDSKFHQDPRYFPSTRHRWARLGDCLLQTVTTRTDSGGKEFNIWRIGSAYGAGLLSMAWYPDSSRSVGDAMVRGSVGLGIGTAANVLREFAPEIRKGTPRPLRSILDIHDK